MAIFYKARITGMGAALAIAITSVSAGSASAQMAAPAAPVAPAPSATSAPVPVPGAAAGGGCFQAPAALNSGDIASFMGNPAALLATYPTGGLPLATRARALAGSDINSVDALISAATNANGDQKSAIGAGLARAARACVASNPQYAALIQQKVAASNLADVVTAFLAASNDVQTAALGAAGAAGAGGGAGAGGAGAAGGIGGGGASNGGSGAAAGDISTSTSAPSFSAPSGGLFFRSAATAQSGT
jgi:hypothetical protein